MEFATVKEWLDKLVDSYNELKSLKYCNTQIELCGLYDNIHIHRGIEVIADAVGIKLNVTYDSYSDYPYRYHFMYRGYEIVQIDNKPLEGAAYGTD